MSLKRRAAALLLPVLFLAAAVLFWRLGLSSAGALKPYNNLVSLRGVGGLTAGDYLPMTEAEAEAAAPLPFALWTQLENKSISNETGGRTAAVAVVAARGDSRLVLPTAGLLAVDDTAGCLLDRTTAESLFGAVGTVGCTVIYEGAPYVVRGLVDAPAPTLALQLPKDSPLPLENITVSGGKAADFTTRHGLEAALTIRYETFHRLANLFAALPLVAAALILVFRLLGQLWHQRDYPLRSAAVFLVLCVLVTALLLALLSVIPAEYVPTRWSDFSFWPELFTSWKAETVALLAAAKLRPELSLFPYMAGSAYGLLSAVLLLAAPAVRRRVHNPHNKI